MDATYADSVKAALGDPMGPEDITPEYLLKLREACDRARVVEPVLVLNDAWVPHRDMIATMALVVGLRVRLASEVLELKAPEDPPVLKEFVFKMSERPAEEPVLPRPGSRFLPGNPQPWKKRWK